MRVELPLVDVLELFVNEPEDWLSLVVPTLVLELPWFVSVCREAQPTNKAAAANMQIICFILILSVPFANIIAHSRMSSNGGKRELTFLKTRSV